MAQLKIDLIVDDKGSIVVKDFGGNVAKSINKASMSVDGFGRSLGAMQKTIGVGLAAGAAIGVAGIVGLTKAMSDAVDLANIQEEAEATLGAVLKSTGDAAGYNLQQMKDMAGAMQGVTTVGDETIIAGQAILATFKNIRGEGFEKATMAALDMSTVMGTDLKSSMTQLGKALNDPVKGLSALSRVGVSFTEEQKEQITVLQESGDIMGAQAVILAELEGEFGGAAAAMRDTFGGSVIAAKNALGDMQEQLGFVITKNQFFIEAAKLAEETFISWTKGIGDNEQAMMELSKTIVVGVVGAIDGLVTGVEAVHLGWTMLKSAIPVVANTMVAATDLMFAGLRNLLLPLDAIFMAMEKAADFMGKEFVNPLDAIQAKLDAVGSVTKGVMEESFQDIIDVKEGYDKLHGAIGTIKTSLENLDVKRSETADIAGKTEQETTATVVVETAKQTAARDKEQAAQLKLAEDLHDRLNQLTLSTYEYKVGKIDEEIAKMQEVAGADRQLQDDIVAYRKLKLAELGEYSNMYNRQEQTRLNEMRDRWMVAETQKTTATKAELRKLDGALGDYFGDLDKMSAEATSGMVDDWQDFSREASREFGNFASDLVTGEFETIGDAWDGLWQTMVATMVRSLATMVAEKAATAIWERVFDEVFHDGTTGVKEDETVALLQQGEMVIPRDYSAMIRDNLSGTGFDGGNFDSLVDATYEYNRLKNDGRDMGYEGGPMGSAEFGAMRDLTKDITGLGIKSALGMTIDPGRSFANIGIGATLDMAGAASARAMGVTSSSYSAIGQSIATTLGSIFGGPAGAMAGALLGGWVGDRIGDALNDRDHEAQRDSLESGTMTRAEFDSRTSSAQTQAPGRQSVLDGFLDDMSRFGSDIADMTGITDARAAIDRAIDNARRDVTDALGITGDSDGGRDNGNDTGHDGSGARGEGNEGNSSPGGIGGYAQGGVVDSLYVPQGDDGFAALSFGEGVVSEQGMKNLAMLNESTFTGAASGGNYSFDFSGLFAGMQRSFDSTVAGYRDSLAEELETMQRDVLAARAEYTDSLSIEATAMADLETAATELTAAQDAYINGTETEKEGLAALVTAAEETYTANRTAAETATAARQAEEAQHAAAEKSYADRLRLAAEVAEATGDEAAAADILIMQRHLEIDAMDASSRSLQQLQWDMDATAAEAERFAANIAALENSMNEWITGLRSALTDAAQAYMSRLVEELNELENNYSNAKNAYMSGLQQEISLLNERAASSESAYRTGLSMSQALAEAMGDEAAAAEILEKSRAMELAAMDESLRPMQEMMWALEDSESTMADYAAGINSIQGAIDSIMGGDATSVQSSDYFDQRYDELLAAAQADPAKAGEFAAFSKQYLDFIEDYGDPKAREKVLKDLWSVEEGYVEDQLDAADQTNVNLIDMTEVMEELSGLEQGYLSAIDARDDNWYQSALDNFTDTKSILTLQQEYNAAKTALDNSTHAETIAELQGIVGTGKTTAELLEDYLKAKSGAAAGDTLVNIYDAVTGLWDNLAEGPLGGLWDFFFPGGDDAVVDTGDGGGGSVIDPGDSGGGGSVVDPGNDGGGGSVVDPGNDGGGGSVIHPADTPDGVPDDWNGYIDGVSWADKYVQDLYATVGRGPDIGSAIDQIDQRGYNDWRSKAQYGDYSSLLADFRSAISSYLETNAYEITLPGTLANYVKNHNTLGLNTGGSFAVNGPSGLDNLYLPQMRVTAGEIVNVSRGDIMADLLREIRAINSSGNGGGDTSIKVYIGNRELRDLTIETLRTDQQAQQVIRRAAHV